MEKRLKNIVVSVVVFSVLFGLMMPVQAPGYAVGGWVFDTDGTTPAADVNVTVTCIETTQSVSFTTEDDGTYVVTLGGRYNLPSPGDTLRLFADAGDGRTNTTEVTATGTTPQLVNLTLENETLPPTVEFIPPTPANESINTTGYVNFTVNVTESVPAGGIEAYLSVWNETGIYLNNETMSPFGEHKYYYYAQLPNGNYIYKAYAKDAAENIGVSETRVLTVQGPRPPEIEEYTISNYTITPPETTEIDVEFSERVEAWIQIEDLDRNLVNLLYHSPGVTNPNPQTWNGTYGNGTQVPDGDYFVNVTGTNTTTWLSVVNNTEIINVTSAAEYNFTIDFVTGYNMITLPVNDTSVMDASTLATRIGDNCTQISKWDAVNQTYVTYLPALEIVNFDIAGGEGYEVVMTAPATVIFTGKGWESPFTISLLMDYNIIGIPVNDTSVMDAATLATRIGDNCTQISKWDAVNQTYVTYLPALGVKNFDIAGGEGYEVVMTGPTSVIFEGKAWSD